MHVFRTNNAGRSQLTSVKIGLSVFVVYWVSFLPQMVFLATGVSMSGYLYYAYHLNNLANFFIYLAADTKFREALKKMLRFA